MRFAGIDGCRGGWFIAFADEDLHDLTFEVRPDLGAVFGKLREKALLAAIDLPIGLAENGPRRCDIEARLYLGPRRSSVFPAPCRRALEGRSYPEASELNCAASGRKLSRQTYGILQKIREVDTLVTPDLQDRIVEAHPELIFAVLDGGPMHDSKRTDVGRKQRLRVLRRAGLKLPEDLVGTIRLSYGPRNVYADDVIDATACLLTATRFWQGLHHRLPAELTCDARGLRMEINA